MTKCMECGLVAVTLTVVDPHMKLPDLDLCEPCLEKFFDFQKVDADDQRRQFARDWFAQRRKAPSDNEVAFGAHWPGR